MGGLVVAILAAVIAMVVVSAVVLAWISQRLSRGKSDTVRLAITLGGLLLGLAAGAAWATATFFESTWSPPPKLRLNLPSNFSHTSVIFLEQPSAPLELSWTGRELPLMGKSVVVDVPASGIVRVRSLGALAGGGFQADVTRNMRVTTIGSGPAASDLDAKYYVYVGFEKADVEPNSTPSVDGGENLIGSFAAFSAYVRGREKAGRTVP